MAQVYSIEGTDLNAEPEEGRVPGIHIEGWMQPVELFWLENIASYMGSIVEVGTWKGRSAYCLASACPNVETIDDFSGEPHRYSAAIADKSVHDEFVKNCAVFLENGRLKSTVGDSVSLAEDHEIVDMVFLDGAHEYESVKADILAWGPRARVVLAGHDYDMEGVRKAVDEVFGKSVKRGYGQIWYIEMSQNIGEF